MIFQIDAQVCKVRLRLYTLYIYIYDVVSMIKIINITHLLCVSNASARGLVSLTIVVISDPSELHLIIPPTDTCSVQ